jgi:undecaprenyl diphosphate synthase
MNLKHLAIIPDGNRRWAKAHLLFPWQGHGEGVKRFWEISDECAKLGIKYLTIWGGSYSNLQKRSAKEVSVLFGLLEEQINDPTLKTQFETNQTRFKVIGEWEEFSPNHQLIEAVKSFEDATKDFDKLHLTILFGYDGQREMLSAISKLNPSGEEVTEENLRNCLWIGGLPDVDFVIRTGGEPHWSAGFMMWLTANSQFYFTETLWPDFKTDKLKTAIENFESRERRLGK